VTRTLRRAVGLAIIGAVLPIVAAVRAATPSRIVSTSPSITETLFALGLGDRVVAVSEYCRFPPAVLKLPKVGTFLKPDAELIAGLRPDLVFVHELSSGIDRRLAGLRISFVVVDRGTLAGVFSSILQIAQATGEPARGDVLVADIERRLRQARSRNLMAVDPSWAATCGAHLNRLMLSGFGAGSVLTAATVVLTGPIGFVGLVVPHLIRTRIGADHRLLMPCAFLGGGVLLAGGDAIGRVIVAPSEIPAGAVMAILGGPYLVWVLRQRPAL
jgi:hypothetical protein